MFIYSEKATKFCEIFPLLLSYVRSATAIKASKAQALPKFWVAVNPISTRGADYAHHSTMGLVWLKFAAAQCQSKVRGRFRKILWPSQNI
jgi:hypothetical protein